MPCLSNKRCEMSGKRYLFDTNAIVALLKGHKELVSLAHGAEFIGISVISRLEFFAFSGLVEADKEMFDLFVKRVHVIDLSMRDISLLNTISEIRMKSSLKLPDAIVAASALSVGAVLVTADVKLSNFTKDVLLFKP